MTSISFIIVVAGFILGFGILLWWLLIRTEGVYLGKRVVVWLYDVYATRYDGIVQHDTIDEHLLLAQPIMRRIHPLVQPLVLDVATGTGRMPLALCQHAAFEGHIIGLDLSRKMLSQAAHKIEQEHFQPYVTLIWADGSKLPFDDNQFDVVTCMEALEFMPNPANALDQLARVLRPGGLLLTTLRINEQLMPGRLWTEEKMFDFLSSAGIENIEFEVWQYDYTKVWGVKTGSLERHTDVHFDRLVRCPCCNGYLLPQDNMFSCDICQARIPTTSDGIIALNAVRCKP